MKKILIDKGNHYRAVLTDTLPYETPLYFTNEYLYKTISDASSKNSLPTYVSSILVKRRPTKQFSYAVRKSGGGQRRLAVPHPASQIGFAEFYRDFDAFIENVCARSSYSLRYPARVGSHFYQAQYAQPGEPSKFVDSDPSSFSKQRVWASSYFSYQKFNQIHKFFGSQEFYALEQQFSWMLKLDIARCFESIYTHSITWAIRGKDFGKQNKKRSFFESEFDDRMQAANWGETNGIIIGPEISRIFSECILQSIDVEVAQRLNFDKDMISIVRYVDDFFIFSNSNDLLKKAQHILEEVASKYNLHFNPSKTETVARPFVAPLAVARQRVRLLLASMLVIARANITEEKPSERFSSRASDKVIAEVRRIARQYNVDYSVLASPALAVITTGLGRLRRRIEKKVEVLATSIINEINNSFLKVSTFFYLMDIRSATSDKLSAVILECSQINDLAGTARLAFEGLVQDSLRMGLAQARLTNISGPEVLNILVAADAVCRKLKGVSNDFLRSALGANDNWTSSCKSMNYFDLTAVLYFSREKHSFGEAKEAACNEIENRISKLGKKFSEYAEETMLFFDYLSCPYIPEQRRFNFYDKIAKELGASTKESTTKAHFKLISKAVRFIEWDGGQNFRALLARRALQPAYDS